MVMGNLLNLFLGTYAEIGKRSINIKKKEYFFYEYRS